MSCAFCKDAHLNFMYHFTKMYLPEKQGQVSRLKLCSSCLRSGHIFSDQRIVHIAGKNNCLLHPNKPDTQSHTSLSTNSSDIDSNNQISHTQQISESLQESDTIGHSQSIYLRQFR